MKVTVLGSGTSTGVPVIGCSCDICQSEDPKNNRTRASLCIEDDQGRAIIIDTSPDFRQQVLRKKMTKLSHVLYTHAHADHCHGFDDLRGFYFSQRSEVNCYATQDHIESIKSTFQYAFNPKSQYIGVTPQVVMHEIKEQPFRVYEFEIEPIFLPHGHVTTTAFRFGTFAYATDFKSFSPEQINLWRGKVHTMVASGVRFTEHHSHSTVMETVELMLKLEVKRGFISHLNHEVDYIKHRSMLPPHIDFAYDGLELSIDPTH